MRGTHAVHVLVRLRNMSVVSQRGVGSGIVRSTTRYYAVGRREDSRAPCGGHCSDVVYDAAGTRRAHVDAPTTRNCANPDYSSGIMRGLNRAGTICRLFVSTCFSISLPLFAYSEFKRREVASVRGKLHVAQGRQPHERFESPPRRFDRVPRDPGNESLTSLSTPVLNREPRVASDLAST